LVFSKATVTNNFLVWTLIKGVLTNLRDGYIKPEFSGDLFPSNPIFNDSLSFKKCAIIVTNIVKMDLTVFGCENLISATLPNVRKDIIDDARIVCGSCGALCNGRLSVRLASVCLLSQ